ncbi:hypothetical protein D9758_009979 [Tetrapyrgos nigripes]|uniref:Uncharacterized protein n=1 Tax=Tetrapyrgos nigripes TaxID=182062 RepID=A0A8H5FRH3_9AGAR|nr:hypothetical protein D9758_009979 [Tetrapyrgos nigripes]
MRYISFIFIVLGISRVGQCRSELDELDYPQCARVPETTSDPDASARLSRKLADNLIHFAQKHSFPVPTFSSSANSALPSGVFIATNFPATVDLAEFLENNATSALNITHLLLSDSSAEDLIKNRGFVDVEKFQKPGEVIWRRNDDDVTDEEEDARSFNRKLLRRYRPLAKDHLIVVNRILKRVAPTLEVFSYLVYTPDEWREVNEDVDYYDDYSFSLRMAHKKDDVEDGLFTLEFPRLRELTLRNKKPWSDFSHRHSWVIEEGADPDSGYTVPHFPSLTHLHASYSLYPIRPPSLAFLKRSFLSLSHVRLTGTSQPLELQEKREPYRGWTLEMWNRVKTRWSPPPPQPNPIPSNLTFIFNPYYDASINDDDEDDLGCGTNRVRYGLWLERLGKLASKFPSSFQLIWPNKEDYQKYGEKQGLFPPDRALRDFEERLVHTDDDMEKGEWRVPQERPWESPDGWQWP